MLSNRDKAREICVANGHKWAEEYYGYKCENCNEFIPYGCEPWVDDDDTVIVLDEDSEEYQSRVAEQRNGAAEIGHSGLCRHCGSELGENDACPRNCPRF